ncbi:MAG: DNA gyrase inhibitor YacG [Gallionella sp.]|nr:DNA gyrase inhibitor YacG [Gallionella sp.]
MSQNKCAPVVTCPHCGKEHAWDTTNRFRPFCCERCKMIDLGKWANEEYRVEQREQDSGNQETQA